MVSGGRRVVELGADLLFRGVAAVRMAYARFQSDKLSS
jgi:hypothetical protein